MFINNNDVLFHWSQNIMTVIVNSLSKSYSHSSFLQQQLTTYLELDLLMYYHQFIIINTALSPRYSIFAPGLLYSSEKTSWCSTLFKTHMQEFCNHSMLLYIVNSYTNRIHFFQIWLLLPSVDKLNKNAIISYLNVSINHSIHNTKCFRFCTCIVQSYFWDLKKLLDLTNGCGQLPRKL